MSVYKTQSYIDVRLDTAIDLTGATVTRVLYKKPSGEKGFWAATVDGQDLVYAVQVGDIDEAGIWSFQSYAEIDGRVALGAIITQVFENNISA